MMEGGCRKMFAGVCVHYRVGALIIARILTGMGNLEGPGTNPFKELNDCANSGNLVKRSIQCG